VPAFYDRPIGIDQMVDQMVGRILARLGIENDLFKKWGEHEPKDTSGA